MPSWNEEHNKQFNVGPNTLLLKGESLLYEEIERRFGVLPNFFKLPLGRAEITKNLWGFAKFAYLDNPLPSLFKERLFVYISRFCRVRYCITRHAGFLIGLGNPAGDASVMPQPLDAVINLLNRELPQNEKLDWVIRKLKSLRSPLRKIPDPDSKWEEVIFGAAAHVFIQTKSAVDCLESLKKALDEIKLQYLLILLDFIRTAHFWTEVQPNLQIEEDMEYFLATHQKLAELLFAEPEFYSAKNGQALLIELDSLRETQQRSEKRLKEEQSLRKQQEANISKATSELDSRIADLEKANSQIREARRAALNLMEDALQSKEALRQSEEKYRTKLEGEIIERTEEVVHLKDEIAQRATDKYYSLFNSIDEGFHIIELIYDEAGNAIDFRYIETNLSFERHTGLKNVAGKLASEIALYPEESWIKVYQDVLRTGQAARFENYNKSTDRWYSAFAFPVPFDGPLRVAVLFNNITERKKQEEKQEYLLKLSDALRTLSDEREIETISCRMLGEHLGVSRAYYPLINELEGYAKIERQYLRNGATSMEGIYFLDSFRWSLAHLRNNKPIVIDNIYQSDQVSPADVKTMEAIQQIAIVSVPLIKSTELVGALFVSEEKPRNWRPDEVDIVRETMERMWASVERARIENALRKSETRLRITMESAVDYAIITLDTQGQIVRWSRGAEKAFGYKESDVIGQSGDIIFTEDDIRAHVPEIEMETARDKGRATDDRWHIRRDGTKFFMSGIMAPIYDGSLSGYVKVARDMTEQKLLEQQKEEFIGIASHELKTPVTAIKAYAEFMNDLFGQAKDVESAALFTKLNTQVDRLTELINSLLDTSRISEGQLLFSFEKFNIRSLAEERISELQLTTQKHALVLSGNGDIEITADRERISQVLTNLISNAIKYSPKGGNVYINIEKKENGVQISVRDRGLGIPEDVKEKIFERFYRVRSATSTYPGMGLGLYISAAIIKRHNGKIWVESTLNQGSVFYFLLPFEQHS